MPFCKHYYFSDILSLTKNTMHCGNNELVRLDNYSLAPIGKGHGLEPFDFVLMTGDSVSLDSDSSDDASLFLRALATLEVPRQGTFFYKKRMLDFSDYRNLLHYKRKVGYVCSDAGLISNTSLYDNLMYMRYYFENDMSITMSEEILELCRIFKLEEYLALRPAHLSPESKRLAIIVREIAKGPELFIIERPRDFLRDKSFETLKTVLRSLREKGLSTVFFSKDEEYIREFSSRKILIKEGKFIQV